MSTPWDAFCRSSASKISFYIPAYSSGGGGEQWPQLQRDSSAGANVKAVQKMLGHASAAMTLDIYADLFDDDLEAVVAALDQARSREVVGKLWARGGQGAASESVDVPLNEASRTDNTAADQQIQKFQSSSSVLTALPITYDEPDPEKKSWFSSALGDNADRMAGLTSVSSRGNSAS
jgi:hypothetical protein